MNLTHCTDRELRQELRKRHKREKLRKRKVRGLGKRKKGMGCRIGDRDEAEKVRRGYVEAGSYVRRDGSEKLVGRDWRARVDELRERSRGQCEHVAPCVKLGIDDVTIGPMRCPVGAADPHHKVKRSVRRDDRLSNLIHLCRWHHQEIDSRKIRSGKAGA